MITLASTVTLASVHNETSLPNIVHYWTVLTDIFVKMLICKVLISSSSAAPVGGRWSRLQSAHARNVYLAL